jgi:hypothetical protein
LRVEPGAGLPENPSRALARPGVFGGGGIAARDRAARVSGADSLAPLKATVIWL